jgi:hypothetical protein
METLDVTIALSYDQLRRLSREADKKRQYYERHIARVGPNAATEQDFNAWHEIAVLLDKARFSGLRR